jgi:hypothetical protein
VTTGENGVKRGRLCVVGTGIQLMGQVTLETESAIRAASKLNNLLTDPVTEKWMIDLNDSAEDLKPLYAEGKLRIQTYTEMMERILGYVRAGEMVCAAFYGHPGVFVYPSHEAVKHAKAEGYSAIMLPGISAEDCLFADLGLDPGFCGCQSFEATDFLVYRRKFDESVPLILWQVSCIGQVTHEFEYSTSGLAILASKLSEVYGTEHEAIVYEAARFPVCPPVIHHTKIGALSNAPMSGISTLVVLPKAMAKPDPDMIELLGIPDSYVLKKASRGEEFRKAPVTTA